MVRIKLKEILDSEENWNMLRLSQETGIPYNAIHEICNDKRKSVSFKHIGLIMQALKLESVDELIEYQICNESA